MCRFTAYHGTQPLTFKSLLFDTVNSLVSQSKACREGVSPGNSNANADGFGVAWYDTSVSPKPARIRSINPAWSNQSLFSCAHLLQACSFMGHVRAATAGIVNQQNSHPFIHDNYSFMHNGDIRHFDVIRRDVAMLLDEDLFLSITGQTDSEHFFALVLHFLRREPAGNILSALGRAIASIQGLQQAKGHKCLVMLNAVLCDGEQMVVMRYISDPDKQPISLYYTDQLEKLCTSVAEAKGLVIASEPLTDEAAAWQEIPLNSFLIIAPDGTHRVEPVVVPAI